MLFSWKQSHNLYFTCYVFILVTENASDVQESSHQHEWDPWGGDCRRVPSMLTKKMFAEKL